MLSGESIEYIACSHDDHIIAISNYRLFATLANGFYIVSYISGDLTLTVLYAVVTGSFHSVILLGVDGGRLLQFCSYNYYNS